jgi:tetratricopeptide (TPR) repeat protein
MIFKAYCCKIPVKGYFLLFFLFLLLTNLSAQKSRADSLGRLLEKEKKDSNRVRLMWQLASAVNNYNPDTALQLSQKALYLAKSISYTEGESRSLGILANTFLKIGNYPRALELNFQKLQLEEKRNKPRNRASVLMSIGVVYVLQDEYRKALEYYSKADSVGAQYGIDEFKYNFFLNSGDAYDRLNISDSAFMYFSKSLEVAKTLNDAELIGASMTGLGHSYRKLGNSVESLLNYQNGIKYLTEANDDEVLCEAALGLASLYQKLNKNDSAGRYATLSLSIAKKDGFLSMELDAAEFLTGHYKKIKNIDSAFAYADLVHDLNDDLNSKAKIRESQILTSDEQFRQMEIEEERRQTKIARYQQLQMLLIGMFIPGFFLLTVVLNRVNIHVKVIRLLGVLSLLFLFEYLTLLLHPTVARLTHHIPVYEILIFVGIAALLIPAHHKLEHWLIQKLVHHRIHHADHDKQHGAALTDKVKSPA